MVVWGISSQEAPDKVEAYKDYTGATFPILLDSDGSVFEEYQQASAFWSAAYPQDWIVDVDGKVAYLNNGYEPDEMIAVLEEQLAEE